MTLKEEILQKLASIEADFRSEAKAFGRLADIAEGSNPSDCPPEKLCYSYSAATYLACANYLKNTIKQIEKIR